MFSFSVTLDFETWKYIVCSLQNRLKLDEDTISKKEEPVMKADTIPSQTMNLLWNANHHPLRLSPMDITDRRPTEQCMW